MMACLKRFHHFPPTIYQRPPEEVKSDLPAMQDLVPIIHNQSDYIRQLEAEVKFCKVCLMVEWGWILRDACFPCLCVNCMLCKLTENIFG